MSPCATKPTKVLSRMLAAVSAEQLLKKRTEPSAPHIAKRTKVKAFKRRTAIRILIRSSTSSIVESIRIAPLFSVLVVFLALFWVTNDIISLIQSLKFSLCLWIVWMQIRMKLFCALKISPLDFILWNITADAENLVVIYKCHNKSSLNITSKIYARPHCQTYKINEYSQLP